MSCQAIYYGLSGTFCPTWWYFVPLGDILSHLGHFYVSKCHSVSNFGWFNHFATMRLVGEIFTEMSIYVFFYYDISEFYQFHHKNQLIEKIWTVYIVCYSYRGIQRGGNGWFGWSWWHAPSLHILRSPISQTINFLLVFSILTERVL